LQPVDLVKEENMKSLQQLLLKTGQYIPGILADDERDLVKQATVTASQNYRWKKYLLIVTANC
jgi:hypothetical protein